MTSDRTRAALADGLRGALAGRPLLLVGGMARAHATRARTLRELGLGPMWILASGAGGDPPEDIPWDVLPAGHAPDALPWERFTELPPELGRQLEAWDPKRRAAVICPEGPPYTTVQGRSVLGVIPPEWVQLECKGDVDAWFDRAEVPRLPSQVLPIHHPDLWAASQSLDQGEGVVWSGVDRSARPAGGARLVRRVRTQQEAHATRHFLRDHVQEVRLARFVEGIPWGVNAFVFPDGVAVGPLVEMVVLRDGPRFAFVGMATFWRPPAEAEHAIRALVRAVGEALSANLGYRGAFTVDGVLGSDGPWPTEINSRTGGALPGLELQEPALACAVVSRLLRAGADLGVSAAAYEAWMAQVAERAPRGFGRMVVEHPFEGDRSWPARWVEDRYVWASDDEPAELVIWAHAMQPGGFVRVVPDPERTPVGPSIAPRLLAGLRLAAERLDFEVPGSEVARDITSDVTRTA